MIMLSVYSPKKGNFEDRVLEERTEAAAWPCTVKRRKGRAFSLTPKYVLSRPNGLKIGTTAPGMAFRPPAPGQLPILRVVEGTATRALDQPHRSL